jgi:hypothetical protein
MKPGRTPYVIAAMATLAFTPHAGAQSHHGLQVSLSPAHAGSATSQLVNIPCSRKLGISVRGAQLNKTNPGGFVAVLENLRPADIHAFRTWTLRFNEQGGARLDCAVLYSDGTVMTGILPSGPPQRTVSINVPLTIHVSHTSIQGSSTAAQNSPVPTATEIFVYSADGSILLYTYTTEVSQPSVTRGPIINTGNLPFAGQPIFITYSPDGPGTTLFDDYAF